MQVQLYYKGRILVIVITRHLLLHRPHLGRLLRELVVYMVQRLVVPPKDVTTNESAFQTWH